MSVAIGGSPRAVLIERMAERLIAVSRSTGKSMRSGLLGLAADAKAVWSMDVAEETLADLTVPIAPSLISRLLAQLFEYTPEDRRHAASVISFLTLTSRGIGKDDDISLERDASLEACLKELGLKYLFNVDWRSGPDKSVIASIVFREKLPSIFGDKTEIHLLGREPGEVICRIVRGADPATNGAHLRCFDWAANESMLSIDDDITDFRTGKFKDAAYDLISFGSVIYSKRLSTVAK